MTTKAKAVAMNISNTFGEFRKHWRNQFDRKLEQAAVALVTWLLSKREVQQAIADKFSGSTPMCEVLRHAVENAVEDNHSTRGVEADDVDGLDRAIESAIENALEDRSFTDAVKDAIDLEDVAKSIDISDLLEEHSEEIANGVAEILARRLRGR